MKPLKKPIDLKEVDEIGHQLREWRNFFTEFFNKVIKDTGKISGFDFSISQLKALAAFRDERIYTMGQLSRNASVTMPSMTEMIDNLEKAGLAERFRDAEDRRVVKVRLTDKGQKLRKKFMDKRRNELKNIFGAMSKDDRAELVDALGRAFKVLSRVNITKSKRNGE